MTMLSEIHLEMTFDAGHRIVGHKGKCARLHGHTYRVEINAMGPVKKPGFVVDFGDLKDLVNEWDHSLLLWDQDPLIWVDRLDAILEIEYGLIVVPFNPTAEHMSNFLAEQIQARFNLMSVSVTLWETPKAGAFSMKEVDSVPID